MSLASFFRALFAKKQSSKKKKKKRSLTPKEMKKHLREYSIGDMVRLKYRNPAEMGFVNPGELTFTRFNQTELSNRVISGTVSKCWYEDYPLDEQMIEITVVKGPANYRKFLFLSQEIEEIERL